METPPPNPREYGLSPYRIGVCADMLIGWAGGRDMLALTIRAISAAEPESRIYLLAPGGAPAEPEFTWKRFLYASKDVIKALIGRPRLKQNPEITLAENCAELIGRIRAHVPGLEVRYGAGLDDDLKCAAKVLELDAIYLAMRPPKLRPECALIGYVPDYQHRHLPNLFSAKEVDLREEISGRLIRSSDAVVMNARAVANDMRKFEGEPLPGLYPLPFAPNLEPEWLQPRLDLLSAYSINSPYFIVCNQFWMHKDHLTAFRALAEIVKRRPSVTLICTGGTTDYRNQGYFRKLEVEAEKLGLGSRLRFVGHIPKRAQIELLKHAVALIQPTLFEGGPGGGSTYEAVALGKRVLITDLAVNREADRGDLRFFPPGDHLALSHLMEAALTDMPKTCDASILLEQSQLSLRRYGEEIWKAIRSAVAANKR